MATYLNVFTTAMPSGFPGDVQRAQVCTIEPNLIDDGTPPTLFGVPVKLVSGKVRPIATSDTLAVLYGFLVREFPAGASQDGLGTSTPPTSGACSVLKRGYIMVKNNAGTPAKNGTVYMRVATPGAGKPIGGIEATADGANTVAITGAYFNGAADAFGTVEIAFNL